MARTRDMKRRAEMAAQALEIIRERGVHRVTMSDIARGLGMKRPALYHYFPNLPAIGEAVLEHLQARTQRMAVARMAPHRHPIDQLGALLQAIVELYEDERDTLVTFFQLFAMASAEDEGDRLLVRERELLEPQRHFMIAMIENGIERGTVRPCDAAALIDTVLTLIDGTQVQRITRNPDLRPMLELVRTRLLAPLRAEPAKEIPEP